MILGFTGTREEPTSEQRKQLLQFMLNNPAGEFHHGCCVGSDAFAHRVAKSCLDLGLEQIVLHPPDKTRFEMAYTDWDYTNCVWWPRKPYLDRNYDIIREADKMIALPKGPEQKRGSGTWSTIRHTLDAKKPLAIIWPDGKIEEK